MNISSCLVTEEHIEAQQFVNVLLEESFPREERRDTPDFWRLAFSLPHVECHLLMLEKESVGFYYLWNFPLFTYIEFIAITPEFRSRGIFSQFFSNIIPSLNTILICEAERIENIQAKRRLALYTRLGFTILSNTYMQPPFRESDHAQPMYLLGYGSLQGHRLTVETVTQTLYKEVYGIIDASNTY